MSGNKKQKKEKQNNQLYKIYEVSGESAKSKNPSCPKCGPGVALAVHKNRRTCGKCGYTEFGDKKVKVLDEEVKEKVIKKVEIKDEEIEKEAIDKADIKVTPSKE